MAKILFFGRFSDLSGPLDIDLPESVINKPSLTAHLSTVLVEIKNSDEIAYMSALSGG